MFGLPDGYEVLLGNGGSTAFWEALAFGMIEERSEHLVIGEFSSKFAAVTRARAVPRRPRREPSTHPGTRGVLAPDASVDLYALIHNETSTGVMTDIVRPDGVAGIVAVDATSGAGGLRVDPTQFDVYYFAPQKAFAGDGGLWLACCSPAAIERIEPRRRLRTLDPAVARPRDRARELPARPDLQHTCARDAVPARRHRRVDARSRRPRVGGRPLRPLGRDRLRLGRGALDFASPFVAEPAARSHVTATIDFTGVEGDALCAALRANGIVDVEPYRKLGRNQLRIAMFPAIEPDDLAALTGAIDYLVDALT